MSRACVAAACVAAAVLAAPPVRALDPERGLEQYVRDQWGPERGYPGGRVYAITQSADGYLWIGAEKGLVRFDGLEFRLLEPRGDTADAGPTVLGVAPAPGGGVLARLRGPALVRYRGGLFARVRTADHPGDAVVTAMLPARDGSILLAPLGAGVLAYRDGRFSTVADTRHFSSSFVIAMAETDGAIWLGTRDTGLLRVTGPSVVPVTRGLPDPKVNCLLPGRDGDLWIGTDRGLARWTSDAITRAGVPAPLPDVPVLDLARDRDGNIWVAAGARGLVRLARGGAVAFAPWDPDARGEVTAVFEDRDGNLWVGTTRGLERLREGEFTTHGPPPGLPPHLGGPVYADAAGRIWFAPPEGGLYRLRDGHVERVTGAGLERDVVYSIAGGGDEVWVGRQRGGLTRVRAGEGVALRHYTQDDGLAQNSVYSVLRARDGAIWAGTLSAGVSRFADGAFTTFTAVDGLASNTVAAILEASDGALWFGTPNGVSTRSPDGWRRYTVREGLPSNDVHALHEDASGGVWVGTAGGLAVIRDGRARAFGNPPALHAPVFGLAGDRHGRLWLATDEHVLRVHVPRLEGGTLAPGDLREFDVADGLVSLEGVRRHRSVIADARGRIWIATRRGLSMADPSRSFGRTPPVAALIEDASADGVALDPSRPVEVPAGRQRLTFTFAGPSLGVPDRVRYRYRLDGFDRDWSEPSASRQAVYTNLAPASYRFRAIASNAEGLWNGPEATVLVTIAPAWWQTAWFRLAVVLVVVTGAWGAYRMRVRQVARGLNVRFEARLAERTRIAQELHDTLLQGFLSASMQLHVAAQQVPADSPARPSLAHVHRLMGRVIEEGRNAVRGLRSPGAAGDDLEHALCQVPAEFAAEGPVAFRAIVEGHPRRLHPLIRDEVYRIGREALVNALRHSGGTDVEIELDYAPARLRLLVRDNGRGIDADVLHGGREGHWGLSGMRERAEGIGGRLTVWSRADAGTEIELSVPGHVAFEPAPRRARRGWPWRPFRRRASVPDAQARERRQ